MAAGTRATRRWFLIAGFVALLGALPLVADDSQARTLAANTLQLSILVGVASVTIGASLAFLVARTDVAGGRAAAMLLAVTLFAPLYLQATGWLAGFGAQGWITRTLDLPVLVDGWRGTILIHTAAAVPWVVLIVAVALRLAEPELEEVALLDGSPLRVFGNVTLRLAAPAVAAALVWVMVTTAGEMTVTDLFGIRTHAEQIYVEFALGDTYGAAPWRLRSSIIAVAWIVAAGLWLAARLAPPERVTPQRATFRFRLRGWRVPLSAALWAMVLVLVGVPLANLIVKAGLIATRDGDQLTRHWSIRQFAELTLQSPPRFAREIGWTLLIGALAASTAVVIGLALAWIARGRGWPALATVLVVAVAVALPGPLVGLLIVWMFQTSDATWVAWLYDRTIAPLWLAQTVRALPLATLILWYAVASVPNELLDLARLDGASSLRQLVRVSLPMRGRAVAIAWIAALSIATGELAASLLVAPPGIATLPITVFGLIHYGVDDRVAGLALFLLAICLCGAMTVAFLLRSKKNTLDGRKSARMTYQVR